MKNNKIVVDEFIDNRREYEFELALQEFEVIALIHQLENAQQRVDAGNPMKLSGAIY